MSVIRGIGVDERWANGFPITCLCTYTLATYSAAGTAPPADGDLVTYSSGANDRVVLVPDNNTGFFGRVKGNPNTVDLTITVEWLDVLGFAVFPVDDLSQVTLGNAAIKDGNTTVVSNVDALSTTGNFKVVSKSGTAGAGTIKCAVAVLP